MQKIDSGGRDTHDIKIQTSDTQIRVKILSKTIGIQINERGKDKDREIDILFFFLPLTFVEFLSFPLL